jgi:hypothetical protein
MVDRRRVLRGRVCAQTIGARCAIRVGARIVVRAKGLTGVTEPITVARGEPWGMNAAGRFLPDVPGLVDLRIEDGKVLFWLERAVPIASRLRAGKATTVS